MSVGRGVPRYEGCARAPGLEGWDSPLLTEKNFDFFAFFDMIDNKCDWDFGEFRIVLICRLRKICVTVRRV